MSISFAVLVLALLQLVFFRLPKAQHRSGRIGDDAAQACSLYGVVILPMSMSLPTLVDINSTCTNGLPIRRTSYCRIAGLAALTTRAS
jgi:hypothetical protein